jgi:hypothetical protein
MGLKFSNNATTTLAADLSSIATSMSVASGTGALFPELGGSDYFYATLQDLNDNMEIVKVTARTDDTMTIVRAQEGTLAIPFAASSRVELRMTAAALQEIVDGLAALTP